MSVESPRASFEELTARQDATARLLVLVSKVRLDERQAAAVRKLAGDVRDWEEFATIAASKFAITYAHRHIDAFARDMVDPLALRRMQNLARATTASVLRMVAAQVAFHRACIEPTNARHAYLKGIALARQYSRTLGDRHSRDIDILVAEQDFSAVIDAATAAGYRVVLDSEHSRFAETERDVRFLAKNADVVTLLGPHSEMIEVHRRLDKLSLNFDLEFALASAESVELPGVAVKTLSRALHFVYLCYHHSRHFWSHLHWLADLDAMLAMPDCDRARIRALADAIGIRPTIEAAFEFHELTVRPDLWPGTSTFASPGGQYLKACLVNLDGNLDLEEELREGMALNDFMAAWQVSPGRYNEFWFNSWKRRLRPTVTQYLASPRTPYLHWTYSLENAASLARNGLVLAFGAIGRNNPKHARSRTSPPPNGVQ